MGGTLARPVKYTVESLPSLVALSLELCPATAFGQQKYPGPDFTEDDGVDDDLTLVVPEPRDDSRVGSGIGRLTEHVSVDEV